MRGILIYIIAFLTFLSCKSQEKKPHIFRCNNKEAKVFFPKIIKTQKEEYTEGKVKLLTTIDSVFIEFHCGGNYSPIISDTLKYKVLQGIGSSKRGINVSTGKFWRKKGRLGYFNCKAKDTTKYNKIFDNFEFKKNRK